MKTTMNQVFELFLKAAEEHPEMSAEELIAANAEQWGIDSACQKQISETFALLDRIDAKVQEQAALREQGKGRDYYIGKELAALTEGRSDEEASAIADAVRQAAGYDVEPDEQ